MHTYTYFSCIDSVRHRQSFSSCLRQFFTFQATAVTLERWEQVEIGHRAGIRFLDPEKHKPQVKRSLQRQPQKGSGTTQVCTLQSMLASVPWTLDSASFTCRHLSIGSQGLTARVNMGYSGKSHFYVVFAV